MTIEIQDSYFNMESYQCEVSVNGEKVETKTENDGKKITIQDVSPEDKVTIQLKNFILAGRHGGWVILIYWIASLLAGDGEPNPFGRPFDAVLELTSIKTGNISIRTNKINADIPFIIVAGSAEIKDNRFVVKKEHRRKWFCGYVLPVNILVGLIAALMFLIPHPVRYVGIIVAVGIVAFDIYVIRFYRLLSAKKLKHEYATHK